MEYREQPLDIYSKENDGFNARAKMLVYLLENKLTTL